VLPRKAAAGAERGSLEPGHASLPGLAGRQLAAGTWRPVPAHKSVSSGLFLDTTALRGQLCRAALLRIASAEAPIAPPPKRAGQRQTYEGSGVREWSR
jgi:hypothetical protein